MLEVFYTADRSCDVASLWDYLVKKQIDPNTVFTDSDCENGANAFAQDSADEQYYLCDYHLGQLNKSKLVMV